MTKIIYTGPEGLHASQYEFVQDRIADLIEFIPTEFISGCAHGVDTASAFASEHQYPDAIHRLVVPNGKHNIGIVRRWSQWAAITPEKYIVEFCPKSSANPHIFRDEVMVNHGDPGDSILVAFPYTPQEYLRSGTWVTVRRARDRGLRIIICPLRRGEESRENF